MAPSVKGKGIYIISVVINKKNGKKVTLLNPAEKGRKYGYELASGKRLTNSGNLKFNKDGSFSTLSDTQRAYRSGYLASRKDSANAYKSKKK